MGKDEGLAGKSPGRLLQRGKWSWSWPWTMMGAGSGERKGSGFQELGETQEEAVSRKPREGMPSKEAGREPQNGGEADAWGRPQVTHRYGGAHVPQDDAEAAYSDNGISHCLGGMKDSQRRGVCGGKTKCVHGLMGGPCGVGKIGQRRGGKGPRLEGG